VEDEHYNIKDLIFKSLILLVTVCALVHLCAPQNPLLCTGAKAATILIEHITKHPQKTVVAWPVVESQKGGPNMAPTLKHTLYLLRLASCLSFLAIACEFSKHYGTTLLFVPLNTKRHPAIDHCTQPDSRNTGVSSEGSLQPLLHGYDVRGTQQTFPE